MEPNRWMPLAERSMEGLCPTREEARAVLNAPREEFLPVMDAAYAVRRKYHGKKVKIHILENAKMGGCAEDCSFCSQSSRYQTGVEPSPMLEVERLVQDARVAKASGAWKYCMVTATRGPSSKDLDIVCEAARRIKSEVGITLCASLGLLTSEKAKRLADAGVDRFNHNLETSERHFPNVVTTHTWQDRVETVKIAKAAGMEACCGGIIGMGESQDDVLDLAFSLRELDVESIPVNFLNPRPGTPFEKLAPLDPLYALQALAMFRLVNPKSDLRAAGGREVILRSLQPFVLFAANSIFSAGYLTTPGAAPPDDHQMIRDLGFEIEMEPTHGHSHSHTHGHDRGHAAANAECC